MTTDEMSRAVEPDTAWAPVMSLIRHELEMALARHPAVGKALTFAEGEALITKLSASLAYDIRRAVDSTYEG